GAFAADLHAEFAALNLHAFQSHKAAALHLDGGSARTKRHFALRRVAAIGEAQHSFARVYSFAMNSANRFPERNVVIAITNRVLIRPPEYFGCGVQAFPVTVVSDFFMQRSNSFSINQHR